MSTTSPILSIKDLRTYFRTPDGTAKAVDGLSYTLDRGETLAVVGESGCGKSVAALSILRLIPSPPGEIVSGEILFSGKNLLQLPMSKMRQIRGNHISLIFQEPTTSLNPVFSIGFQLSRVFRIHQHISAKEARRRSLEMLAACEIPSPDRILDAHPHQLSGGMRQRAMIAMALGCGPEILIADEPTTALDVTIQAQILDLMQRLQNRFGMAMILITHDLGIVAKIAQRVVVMYAGLKVEEACVRDLFEHPCHPYTIALMKSLPVLGRTEKFLSEIKGVVPPPYRHIPGCRFAERCSEAITACHSKSPEMKEIQKGHWVACIRR